MLVLINTALFAQMPEVVINELLASNQTTIQDPEFEQYADWLELYNTTGTDIDLSGYFLTDNLDDLAKWRIPESTFIQAEGYLLVWADNESTGLHTNFKIKKSGEVLALCDPDTSIVDQIYFGPQEDDISYGRNPQDYSQWTFFSPPSPGILNDSSHIVNVVFPPQFSIEGGFYSGSVTLSFSQVNNFEVYYTLDGSPPDDSAILYTDPITLNQTTPVRAISYLSGHSPSAIVTHTYFLDIPANLPIISIVSDPDNFFDDEIGIYVTGTNGTGGYCAGVIGNVNQDWERPVNLEIFDMDGVPGINQRAGVKIFGGCSRHRFPQKSLALFARSIYGDGSFNYRLFEEKNIDSFESFVLRSGADDQLKTMFRDAAAQQMMVETMQPDYQAYQPVVVYLNGEYWGIHNIREKLNEHYFDDNFGVDPDEVNILANNGSSWNTHHGSNEDYLTLMGIVNSQDLSDNTQYELVGSLMDVDQYINYMIGHMYQAESDWPGNNIKFWKANTGPYSRWRWVNFDMDGSLNAYRAGVNMIHKCTTSNGPSWPNPEWSTRLFRNLLSNPTFKHKFLNRYAWHMNTTFDSTRIITISDSLADRLRPEMPAHIDRWGGQVDPVGSAAESWIPPTFDSMEMWESNVNEMRIFATDRQEYTVQNIINHFGLSGASQVTLELNIPGSGVLTLDGKSVGSGYSGKYFNDIPLSVNASPIHGYQFSHWDARIDVVEDEQIVETGSEWKFHDFGGNLGTGWRQSSFNDDTWSIGIAQFGYGDGDETTVVSYGDDPQNKHITTYFRKSFSANGTGNYDAYGLNLLVDDGAVVYLNGTEVGRVNMPDGFIYYSTQAASTIPDESAFHHISVPAALVEEGINVLSVEVHQASPTSSDISFDCSLIGHSNTSGSTSTLETPENELTLSGDITLTANFEIESNPLEPVVVISEINYQSAEIHDTKDWLEIYNASTGHLDLTDWTLMDDDGGTFVFPDGYLFAPGEYLVITRDMESFQEFNPFLTSIIGDFDFGLSSEGDHISLVSSENEIVDEVDYGIEAPWPTSTNSMGHTIELIDLTADNSLGENWIAAQAFGTPGRAYNSVSGYHRTSRYNFSLYPNYPNPFNPSTKIRYTLPRDTRVRLHVYDILGRNIFTLYEGEQLAGNHEVSWNGINRDGQLLTTGLYFCRIEAGEYRKTIKMVFLR